MNTEELILQFLLEVTNGNIEIYNKFSLQHELGIYLRNKINDKNKKVQFERNIAFFDLETEDYEKKEIDIVIYQDDGRTNPDVAIELKFPRNGAIPEQMFHICKDVMFTEQLMLNKFNKAYVLSIIEDHLFYEGRAKDGIYKYFRTGHLHPFME